MIPVQAEAAENLTSSVLSEFDLAPHMGCLCDACLAITQGHTEEALYCTLHSNIECEMQS